LDDTHANPFSAQRSIILSLLLILAAGSWVMLVWQSAVSDADMTMTSSPMGMSAPLFLVIMMVAMMLPSAAPMVLSFYQVQASNQRQFDVTFVSTLIFVTAYIVMWTLAGAPAYAGAIAIQIFAEHGMPSPAVAARLGGVVLVAAGVYQLTRLKGLCLSKCRTPTTFIITSSHGHGASEALRLGLLHGAYCLGCCWALFVILFPLGMSNVGAMAAVALVIFAEKTLPWPWLARYAAAFALVLYGALVITSPQFLPTYEGRRGGDVPAEMQMKTPGSTNESKLPLGNATRFRNPGDWERYRWPILLIITALSAQIALLVVLRNERRRRLHAEMATATIAHELSQPLSAILANSEAAALLTSSATNPGELREILSDIQRDDERAIELIRRLRSLLTKAPFERADNDLNKIVQETIASLSRLARSREFDLRNDIVPGELRIQGDRVQIQEVIINLIVNAMDAMSAAPPAKRQITVSTTRVGHYAEVAVSDTGPGIPVDKAEIVFQPFFSTKPQGMGMGLYLARTIVEAHGGRIWADNQTGAGAVFHIRLPLTTTEGADTR
jgi:signal transduction histidine kinase/predicted metal-binding membrane protein